MEALALDPDDAASWELLGDLRSREERWREALGAYDRATTLDGRTLRPWLQKGRVLRLLGELDEAEEAVAHARTLAPDDPTVAEEAAALATARGKLQKAADLYAVAARSPDAAQRADAAAQLAAVHERRGDEPAAARALAEAAEAEPARAGRWARAAAAFERVGALEDAARAWERLAEVDARSDAWENAALLHLRRGAVDEAMIAWQHANDAGDRPGAWAGIARLRLNDGDRAGADAAAARAFAVRRRDQRPETVERLATLLVDLGRGREAATLLRPHVLRTGDTRLTDLFARAQAAAGWQNRALGTCRRLRGGDPGPFCSGMLAPDVG